MKVTALTIQQRDKNRVNVMVDGVYRLSLDIAQVIDLGIKIGQEYSETEFLALEIESQFGKLYARALEYCLSRPHSQREVRDYLFRKTRDTRNSKGTLKRGVSVEVTDKVFRRLVEKGHINDETFAQFWVENRRLKKGVSQRGLRAELRAKGVDNNLIEQLLAASPRSDKDELTKVIAKKRVRYDDERKLMQYLAGQGFDYDDIKQALSESESQL